MRFGTDGLRGRANADLTPELALRFGRAAARSIGASRWYIARDTRQSGPMLAAAVAAGLAAEGVDVVDLGVAATPVAAFLAREPGSAAVVVSASHNPWPDNGLKLFAPGGHKLSDAVQNDIEQLLDEFAATAPSGEATAVGWIVAPTTGLLDRYIDDVVAATAGRSLTGLKVVLDCGHGAAVCTAPAIFERLGADVTVLHAAPDGRNINDAVGSTDPTVLAAEVVRLGADIGLAFDGDADRVIAVDELGAVVDGDRLLGLFAVDLAERDLLSDNTLVVTVMSNLGLHRAMAARGIEVLVTPVGDRHVLEAMANGGLALGGEQSGHLVFGDFATTGDGVLAGVLLCDLVHRARTSFGSLASAVMEHVPQLLVNVPTAVRPDDPAADLATELRQAADRLRGNGRVLVRSSGTEPLVRVMVEATELELAHSVTDGLVTAVIERYGSALDS